MRLDNGAHLCKPATDRAGNVGPSTAPVTVTIDTTPSTITSLNVPARATPGFVVSWSAQDNLSGVSHYDVQYANESGVWTDWLVSTPLTQAVFTGPGGHVYTFHVSATDELGNASGWQTSGQVTVSLVKKYYAAAGRRVAMRADNVVYYLHGDHLGSTSLVTTGAGEVVARQLYLPYGAPRWGSGTLPTDFTFTGQRADATGLMYYRARYYSSYLNRWIQPDSIVPQPGNPQDLNRFSYARNNPLKYIDRDGHIPIIPLIILGVMAVGMTMMIQQDRARTPEQVPPDGKLSGMVGTGLFFGAGTAGSAYVLANPATAGAACLATDCVNKAANQVSNFRQSDLAAVEKFAEEAKQINKIERGYGSFGELWTYIAKASDPAHVFLNRVGDRVTGMMKVNPTQHGYEIKFLEGIGEGAGTTLIKQAIQDSIAKGYGGSVYLHPAEKAVSWYLSNFPGAQEMPNGALYWSSQAAQAVLNGQ